MAKIGKYETEQKVLKAMQKTEFPCTIQFIQKKIGLHYSTTSKVLAEMVKKGSVLVLPTTRDPMYVTPSWKPVILGKDKDMKVKNNARSLNS